MNREAELKTPSRVACSDLLDHVSMLCNPLFGCLQRIALPNINSAALLVKVVNEIHGKLNWVILDTLLLANLLIPIPKIKYRNPDSV